MKFKSTRGALGGIENSKPATAKVGVFLGIKDTLMQGLAEDGGLFIPEAFPRLNAADFSGARDLATVGEILLRPFFAGDAQLSAELGRICKNAFNFPIPLVAVPSRPGDFILDLYEGPTSAFKDVGARFLAACMEVILRNEVVPALSATARKTVLVATSGDTGGAVAGAFVGRPGIDVVILFPKGRISPRQEKQLCAWGENIRAVAVRGAFDDCQRIVKEALQHQTSDRASVQTIGREWLSANSINLGRILPQMVYYAWAALERVRIGGGPLGTEKSFPGFIIPSGNLGNSVAALWAKRIGLPIGPVVLACNANRPVVDFLKTGSYVARSTIPTLANAMDVGNPSNLERMRVLYPTIDALRAAVKAQSVSDAEIEAEIRGSEREWGQVMCPHTATAGVVRKAMDRESSAQNKELRDPEWILVATAHPAKFETIVEPLIGRAVPMPLALEELMRRPSVSVEIEPTYAALLKAIEI